MALYKEAVRGENMVGRRYEAEQVEVRRNGIRRLILGQGNTRMGQMRHETVNNEIYWVEVS